MIKDIQPLTGVPVRFFAYDEEAGEAGEGSIVEVTEDVFMYTRGTISYERHTVFANGVSQICLTKI
jgi:hypothetical protein